MKKYELKQKMDIIVEATQFCGDIQKLEIFLEKHGTNLEKCFKILGIDEKGNYIISCNTLHGEEIIKNHYIVFVGERITIFTRKAFEFFFIEKE